jgi:hypothetical protein
VPWPDLPRRRCRRPGGLGRAAATIAAAFPDLKCTVLDLPQVVAKAAADPSAAGTNNNVQYVAGDMFQSIPPADAVFLKWILHDWSDDDECVKILLKNCKQAIPPRAAGGKVIIIDVVVGSADEPSPESDVRHVETQVLFDLMIMSCASMASSETSRSGGGSSRRVWVRGLQDYHLFAGWFLAG